MPDLTEDEADRCPYCGAILRWPPICCERMADEADDREDGPDEYEITGAGDQP